MFFQPDQQNDKDMNYVQHYQSQYIFIPRLKILYMKGIAWIVMGEMVWKEG